jgi:hypothetical protein
MADVIKYADASLEDVLSYSICSHIVNPSHLSDKSTLQLILNGVQYLVEKTTIDYHSAAELLNCICCLGELCLTFNDTSKVNKNAKSFMTTAQSWTLNDLKVPILNRTIYATKEEEEIAHEEWITRVREAKKLSVYLVKISKLRPEDLVFTIMPAFPKSYNSKQQVGKCSKLDKLLLYIQSIAEQIGENQYVLNFACFIATKYNQHIGYNLDPVTKKEIQLTADDYKFFNKNVRLQPKSFDNYYHLANLYGVKNGPCFSFYRNTQCNLFCPYAHSKQDIVLCSCVTDVKLKICKFEHNGDSCAHFNRCPQCKIGNLKCRFFYNEHQEIMLHTPTAPHDFPLFMAIVENMLITKHKNVEHLKKLYYSNLFNNLYAVPLIRKIA